LSVLERVPRVNITLQPEPHVIPPDHDARQRARRCTGTGRTRADIAVNCADTQLRSRCYPRQSTCALSPSLHRPSP
jgi:hypothetical protein